MSANTAPNTVRQRIKRTISKDSSPIGSAAAKTHRVPFFNRRVHTSSESLLSSASGFENYRGVFNLCIILLLLSNFRVALDNILKYGVLVDPFPVVFIFLEDPYRWPSACLIVGSNIYIQIAFHVETALAEGKLKAKAGLWLHIINLASLLLIPAIVISVYHPPPWASCTALMWNTIVFLKLISYINVNQWCREGKIHSLNLNKDEEKIANGKPETKPQVEYPKNLSQKDLYYFMMCPTLCYELNFPKTPRIRVRFLMRRIFEVLFLVGVAIAIVQQWIVPTVVNSLKPFQAMDMLRVIERIMKLAIPNHLLWLTFFYTFFHSILNIVAEILQFGDRHFYSDWWNAHDIQYFWQHWNIPVHRWALRHIYQPLLQSGYSKFQAQLAVFLLSAFFHEYLVSIPLHMVKLWAFLAMLGQIPLHFITKKFTKEHSHYGNAIMWLSLIVGQPVALMMYWHDYYVMHFQAASH